MTPGSGPGAAKKHPLCDTCRGLGYLPLRTIRPYETRGWPPPVAPAGPWRRCTDCSTAQDLDDLLAAKAAARAAARALFDGEAGDAA